MAVSSGLYSMPEFVGRNVIKLAPDSFIAINTQVGSRFLAPVSTEESSSAYQSLDVRGGITSINVNAAVHPAGASRASIEVVAPIYKGLHEDYYYTLPSGARKIIFQPMMEVKVYMKGFKLKNGNPIYYPVFWGFITGISDSYSGGSYNISLSCSDLLSWWNYQKLQVVPNTLSGKYGAPSIEKFPTVFESMNPWQIIYNLFYETEWKDNSTPPRRFDFTYPKFSKIGAVADFGNLFRSKENTAEGNQRVADNQKNFFMGLAENANLYWQKRFGNNRSSAPNEQDRLPFEMFGLLEPVNLNNDKVRTALSFDPNNREYQQKIVEQLSINIALLTQVQPYGSFNIYDGGASGIEHTKLEIAREVCEQTEMEFYQDTNGTVVFKPPFYNLDVTRDPLKTYVVKAKDVISFSEEVNTDNICTFLQLYGPREQFDPDLDTTAVHIDFDLLKKYGLRYQTDNLRYGNNPDQLRLLAAAKMAKINGRAVSGSVSIPLRPEMRLGYPVYIHHVDAYFYVSGINHSFSMGSSATTTLSLEYRRDRVYSGGEIEGTQPGDVLDAYVFRYDSDADPSTYLNTFSDSTLEVKEQQSQSQNEGAINEDIQAALGENDRKKWSTLNDGNVMSGPKATGFYKVSKAVTVPTGNSISGSGEQLVQSNELIMLSFPQSADDRTGESIPYTDLKGYRHIGAFPYGANLNLVDNGVGAIDNRNPSDKADQDAKKFSNASPDNVDSSIKSGAQDQPTDSSLQDSSSSSASDTEAQNRNARDIEEYKKRYGAHGAPTPSQIPQSPASRDTAEANTNRQADALTGAESR